MYNKIFMLLKSIFVFLLSFFLLFIYILACVAMSRIIDLAFNSKYLREYESIFPYEVILLYNQ